MLKIGALVILTVVMVEWQAVAATNGATSSVATGVSAVPSVNASQTVSVPAPTKSTNVALTGETAGNLTKPWMMSIDINHLPKIRDDHDAVSEASLLFDYIATPQHTFRLVQGVQKLYEIRPGQSEVYPSDTSLTHLWRTPWMLGSFKTLWVNSLSVPISEDSQNRDLITTWTTQGRANYAYGRFFVSLRPFARYHWYEFKTSPGGDLLPLYTIGASALGTMSLTDRLTLVASASYSSVYLSASQYSSRSVVEPESQGRYSVDVSLNYDWTRKFSSYLYYGQGDAYILDGRYEINIYDPRTTRVGVGATLNF